MLEDDQAIADELEYYELEYKIQTLIEGFRRQEQLKRDYLFYLTSRSAL